MKNDKIIKIIRVAKKYYESHMDQKVIAQEEGMSVSTVSRMLKKAEEMGYIKITVEYPVLSNEELSASLKKKYNLEKVFLVPSFQMRLLQYRKMSVEQQQKIYLPI
ncbi:MAG: winged helix-turn-helix transcriptional regulator [Anaerobutyricum hallii]